ncbi:hypothetical protein MTP99_014081 [Tenebrio molitor]|nr:hypothetical protein MTP99_014081 [Tenebrio molitor]
MTGFLMIRITPVWSESFRTDFRGFCSILPRTFSTTSSVSVDDVLPVAFALFHHCCCGAGRCRKLDSGTPVRVALAVMIAPAQSLVSSSPQGSGGSSCRNTDLPLESPGYEDVTWREMSSRGVLDCDYGIVAASSLLRHLTVI